MRESPVHTLHPHSRSLCQNKTPSSSSRQVPGLVDLLASGHSSIHFLQGDEIATVLTNDRNNAIEIDLSIDTLSVMDVVGHDANRILALILGPRWLRLWQRQQEKNQEDAGTDQLAHLALQILKKSLRNRSFRESSNYNVASSTSRANSARNLKIIPGSPTMMLGLRRSLLFCTLIMIATTSFERAFGQDAGSPTEQQPPAAAPPSDSSARRCADGTICPRVALGAIVDTSGNCVAWVYRTEKCTGFFAVADLACGTQPGSCASDPCNCARNLIGVPKVSVTTTGGADPVGATTAEPTRYFSPAIKSSVSKAVQFYSNSLSTKESTKYAKAMTATGEILIRLETYKHTASGDVWGWDSRRRRSSRLMPRLKLFNRSIRAPPSP